MPEEETFCDALPPIILGGVGAPSMKKSSAKTGLAQVTIGPVIGDGFYYDFSYKRHFTPEE